MANVKQDPVSSNNSKCKKQNRLCWLLKKSNYMMQYIERSNYVVHLKVKKYYKPLLTQ